VSLLAVGRSALGTQPVAGEDSYPDITVVVTGPTGVQSITSPLVGWTFSSALGNTQDQYRILIYDEDGTTVIADSDWQSGVDLSWQTPFQLSAGNNLTVQVTAISDAGTSGFDTDTFHIIVPSVGTDLVDMEMVHIVVAFECRHDTVLMSFTSRVTSVEITEEGEIETVHDAS